MKHYITLLALAVFINSCSTGIEEKSIYSISDDLNLSLSQGFDQSGSHLLINIQTQDELLCSNAEFSYTFGTKNNGFELDILDIIEPSECNNIRDIVSTPASLYLPHGSNELSLTLKSSITSRGQAKIDNEKYVLDFNNPQGFLLPNLSINKIGPDAVWGKISLDNNLDQVSKTIADRLSIIEDTDRVPEDGDYGIFKFVGGVPRFNNQGPNDYTFFIYYKDWEVAEYELNKLLSEISTTSHLITNSFGINL